MKNKKYILSFLSLIIIPFYVFAQSPLLDVESGTTTTSSGSVPETIQPINADDFFKTLDAPKIIKNSVRILDILITKAEVNSNNELVIEGTVDITNYGSSQSSNLYMSAFTGIKGSSYYLQFPFYREEKSEPFVLAPKETVTKNFTITEKNFLEYGLAAVEIWVTDEYDKKNHSDIAYIPSQILEQAPSIKDVFSDFIPYLTVNNVQFVPSNGPTFYPDTEDMFINFDFKDISPTFIQSADIKIFNRNFFTQPIKQYNQRIADNTQSRFNFAIPKDLSPGVYPFEIVLVTDGSVFLPHVYGRFIVGGNMSKVLDVTLNYIDLKKVTGLTIAVQGNPQDIVDPDREGPVAFGTEITLFDKQNNVVFTKKVEDQYVYKYRNIDIDFDTQINGNKIYKAKVDLIDERGVFSTYTKEFVHKEGFNYWNILYILGGLILIGILLKVRKTRLVKISPLLLMLFLLSSYTTEAGMTPTPNKHFGAFIYDAYDFNEFSNINCGSVCSGVESKGPEVYANDIDIKRFDGDSLLSIFEIDLGFTQPITVAANPSYCYAPGQIIPVVFTYEYGICSNSPVGACTSDTCASGSDVPIQDYADIYLSNNANDWYWNLRNWDADSSRIYNTDSYSTDMTTLVSDEHKQMDLDYLYNYIGLLDTQSQSDYLIQGSGGSRTANSLTTMNMNEVRISEIKNKILRPTTSTMSSININVGGFSVNSSYDYSILAPEKPGVYNFYASMYFQAKQGYGYYVAEHQIKVCNTLHDADYVMPGKQYIDTNGDFRNENGALLSGYMIQRYPVGAGIINGYIDFVYDQEGELTGDVEGEVDGSNQSPYNEFNFVTVGNYCGSKSLSIANYYGTWSVFPDVSYGQKFLTNQWVNYYTTVTNVFQKNGHPNLLDFIQKVPNVYGTKIPVSGHHYNGTRYYTTNGTSTPSYINLHGSNYEFIVHKEGNDFKFINLLNSYLPKGYGGFINNALKLEDLAFVPKMTFGQMLSSGYFNFSNIINSTENTSTNTFLIKEDRTINGEYTSCALYEDFCSSVDGIQYLDQYSTSLRLYHIDANGNHNLASSTNYLSPKATVDAMCSAVSTSNLTLSCSAISPASNLRYANTPITFQATVGNHNPGLATTYTWTNASRLTNQSQATTTYSTVGPKTNVTVTATNGTSTSSVITCPVEIVNAPINAYCDGNTVYPSSPSTSPIPSTYTAYPSDANSFQWKNSDGSIISGQTNRIYSPSFNAYGTYLRRVDVTKNGVTETVSCSSTVQDPNSLVDDPTAVSFVINPAVTSNINNDPNSMCKYRLSASNVSTCRLISTDEDINLNSEIISNSLSIINRTIPIGVYTLACRGTGNNAPEIKFNSQKCVSNPFLKEN